MSLHPPARAAPAARRETERNVDFRGRTMRILPLGCALLLLASAGTAAGSDVNVACDVHSDYDFALTSRSLILTRADGAPTTVRMRQRSEEHTSALQSLMRIPYAFFCLKKTK